MEMEMEKEMEKEFSYVEERDGEGGFALHGDPQEGARRPPTWRGFLLAILAAVILSVSATLLLGGSFGFSGGAASTGCGPGSECCPPADSLSGGR